MKELSNCVQKRVVYVGARGNHLPQSLALINFKKFTPLPAVCFQGLVSALLLCIGDVFLLINCVSFVEALSFLVCVLALLVFRRKHPEWERPIKVNIVLPITFAITCAFLVVVPIFTSPGDTLIGLGFLCSGIPAYIIGVKWRNKPRSFEIYMAKFNIAAQKLILGVHQEGKSD